MKLSGIHIYLNSTVTGTVSFSGNGGHVSAEMDAEFLDEFKGITDRLQMRFLETFEKQIKDARRDLLAIEAPKEAA